MSEALGISAGIGFSVIAYLFAGAALFLIIGIVSVVISGYKNLYKRHHKTWNILTKLYYLYIPLVFAFFGAILGGLFGLNRSIIKNIDEHALSIIESTNIYLPDFQSYLNQNIGSRQVAGFTIDKVVDDFFEKDTVIVELGFMAGFQDKLGKLIFKGFIEGVMEYSAHKIGTKKSSLKETIQIIRGFDIKKADIIFSTVILKTIKKQVNRLFNGMYLSQLINLLLLLSLPVAESIVYFCFIRNKMVSREV